MPDYSWPEPGTTALIGTRRNRLDGPAKVTGGAFQSYTLGNILAAQFYAATLKAHPEIPGQIKQGQFETLRTQDSRRLDSIGEYAAAPGCRSKTSEQARKELEKLAKDEPENYSKFWEEYGRYIKEGVAIEQTEPESIYPLLRFHTTKKMDQWS